MAVTHGTRTALSFLSVLLGARFRHDTVTVGEFLPSGLINVIDLGDSKAEITSRAGKRRLLLLTANRERLATIRAAVVKRSYSSSSNEVSI